MGHCCSSSVVSQVSTDPSHVRDAPVLGKSLASKHSHEDALPHKVCFKSGLPREFSTPSEVSLQPVEPPGIVPKLDNEIQGTESEEVPNGLPIQLLPVQATEDEAFNIFSSYKKRIEPRLSNVLDCSWEALAGEAAKAQDDPGTMPAWHWLLTSGRQVCHSEPVGLVVFRHVRGALGSHGQICHLSLSGDGWLEKLPCALDALRREMFRSFPIKSIRVLLRYSIQEDGSYQIDKAIENVFKQSGFRWFQLTNTSDGKRGQTMDLRRNEAQDPPAPSDVADLHITTHLFMPRADASVNCDLNATSGHNTNKTENAESLMGISRIPVNSLVMAECLHRDSLLEREPCLQSKAPPDIKTTDSTTHEDCDTDMVCASPVPQVIRRLKRMTSLSLVCTEEYSSVKACVAIVQQDVRVKSTLEELSFALGGSNSQKFLCGRIALGINWKSYRVMPSEPSWVCVPAHATCKGPGGADSPTVAFLGTTQEDIFVAVWKLTPQTEGVARDDLFKHCQQVLRDSSFKEGPSNNVAGLVSTSTSASQKNHAEVTEVQLPTFELQKAHQTSLPVGMRQAQSFSPPIEVATAILGCRAPPQGALQRKQCLPPSRVIKLDTAFVLCVWHVQLDELEVPLVATLVDPANFIDATGSPQ